jgi:hypothetical protein
VWKGRASAIRDGLGDATPEDFADDLRRFGVDALRAARREQTLRGGRQLVQTAKTA